MNNRPLFWAVMCFALGEVTYIIAGKGSEIGTALVVLIFAVFLIRRTRLSWQKKVLYPLVFALGIARIFWADYTFVGNVLFGGGDYKECIEEYDGYSVGYTSGRNESNGYLKPQVELEGVGLVDNVVDGSSGYNVTVKVMYSKTEEIVLAKEYKIIIYSVQERVSIGDRVCINGTICDFVPSYNPGEFNRRNYYKAREIMGYSVEGEMELVILEKKGNEKYRINISWIEETSYKLKSFLCSLKGDFGDILYSICDQKTSSLFAGILLGEKGDIPDQDMLLYRLSGIAHIFAISGLHIGIVGGLLYKLLRKAGLKFLPAAVLAMLVTLLYGVMTGFSFSTIRAVVMLGLSLGGEVLGRRYDMLTGMGLALLVLLAFEPYRIMDGGLILSFGAVAGVVVSKYIVKLLEKNKAFRQLQKKRYRWLYGVISAFIFSTGISLVTTPLVAYMYFQIPLYSVVLNMIIVPLMTVTVFCGFFGVLVGTISIFFGKLIIFPGVLSLKLYKWMCTLFQQLPMSVINTGKPSVREMVIYYLVLIVVLILVNPDVGSWIRRVIHDKTKKWIPYMMIRFAVWGIMGVLCLFGLVGIILVRVSEAGERIVFLDVGQGDGVLINTPSGTNIVIDIGSSSNDSLGEYVTYPALLVEHKGVVDYWFVTHFDKDHMSGLEYLINSEINMGVTIHNLVVSENCQLLEDVTLIQAAEKKGINIIRMKQGDCIMDESFSVKAVHPNGAFDSDDRNEQSLVVSYESDSFKILFTGDVGEDAIKHMLDGGCLDNDYDILKVPHHGSKYSYSMKFLEQTNCEVAVISCATKNSYGHPHKEMLQGLYNAGCDVYRTDYMGAVRIKPNRKVK